MKTNIETKPWGELKGKEISLYTFKNASDLQISITNFGATIQSLSVPDANGNFEDVVLGYDGLTGYINDPFYMGSIVGRYANRIAGGKVQIDWQEYQLTVKEGGYHHHGGKEGFNKKVWDAKPFTDRRGSGVMLEYLSADGEEGFPGNLVTKVTYTLNDQNQLIVDFTATTDKTTLINLTQHAYFNLGGHNNNSILNHQMMLPLADYLPVNAMQVPTGVVTAVADTPFDFRKPTAIGELINSGHPQLVLSNGYDHSWVVKKSDSDELKLAASLWEPASKRRLNVFTTEPAVHIYAGNFLDGTSTGKSGATYPARSGICLETQHYPDAPNHADFPGTLLKAGKVFKSRTIFEFAINNDATN